MLLIGTLLPSTTQASVLDIFLTPKKAPNPNQDATGPSNNLQTMDLPQAAMNLTPTGGVGGGDVSIIDNSAVIPQDGPSGTIADIVKPKNGTISTYIVRSGDTLSGIAKLFDVSPNTIIWANDLPRNGALKVGQNLTILPITGIEYTVKNSDTIASIAKHYGADAGEIASFNGIDDSSLSVGSQIIIPDGELGSPSASSPSTPTKKTTSKVVKKTSKISEPAHNVGPEGSASEIAYYIAPLSNYIETQSVHGYNAVDLAASKGTPIVASAAGDVVVAREGGWNGGYGSYVVISHRNGSQTLYAHMSKVSTYDGDHVQQGEVIGSVGQTGIATGPHVHFEIRNGIKNPF